MTDLSGFVPAFPTTLKRLVCDESGQDLIEYALIAALVALAAVASMKGLASSINSAFTSVSNSLTSAI